MRAHYSFLLAVLFASLASGVFAQSSAGTDQTPTTAEQTDETQSSEQTEDSGATGKTEDTQETGGQQAPEEPLENIVAVHGDWQVRCRNDNDTCFMYQLAIDAREVPIAEVSIVPLKTQDDRVAGFTVVTPLRTLLTEGLVLQIDNGRQQKYQFGWCTEAGCAARFAVRTDGLAQFKRGNKARLTVLSVEKPDVPVILDVSLKGFTAAFDDLSKR